MSQSVGAVRELNLSVRSLEEITESEHRFRKLVEALPDAILVHTDGRIVFVNPFAIRLHKATRPEQLLGHEINEFIQPELRAAIKNRIDNCYLTGEASVPMEVALLACDGSSVDAEAVAIPISWHGAPAIEVVLRDTRERKRAEQAAYDWQKRLELAQKAGLRIGLWDWDVIANTVTWSDESYRQFGLTRDTFTGRVEEAVDRIHPEDRSRVQESIQRVLDGKSNEYSSQYRLVRPDGTTCWIDAHGVMVRNGSQHMLGVGIDITDLKNSAQSLKDSEEKYLLLLNSTAEAIYGLDLEGNCTFCNPACIRLLGYERREDLLGKNMHALMHHSRADGTPYAEQNCEIYVAVREGRPSHVSDEVLWRADGTSFAAEYWSYPMYKTGETVGAVVTFLDISDRKRAEEELRRSEQKYRQLFENATHGIFWSKPDGTLLDVNAAMVAMLGYSSREELLERNLNVDIYEDQVVRKAILESYGPSERVEGVEVKWRRKDGRTVVVRISGSLVSGKNGSVDHYEVIAEDITERRSLEEQLRQSQKMEAVGLLAGGISHDFNNLLGVILGNAELLLETTQSEKQQRRAEQIKKASVRAAQLTRQLLAFSRKQVLYPTVLNLNTVVADVGMLLQRLIGEDIEIVTESQANLGSVRADRGQIEQILMNLATNARDAMPNGGTLSIRTENARLGNDVVARYQYVKTGHYVHLAVTDTGTGMTEEVLSRVFEPFFTTKEKGRGTGLGLATVYGIVKQSGGYIWVSSTLGTGTTFNIYLPKVDEKPMTAAPKLGARSEYPRGTETILLLEDDDSLRQVTCEFLTASGYDVIQAGRGDLALDLATQYTGRIPLVISDVVMPEMSGPLAVSKLRVSHPEMQALYVSGYAATPIVQALIAEGALLLQKPVSRLTLLTKVDELLHLRTNA
ncbi:MAG: PAS domain S-box protein [Terriglobales bacterium]